MKAVKILAIAMLAMFTFGTANAQMKVHHEKKHHHMKKEKKHKEKKEKKEKKHKKDHHPEK